MTLDAVQSTEDLMFDYQRDVWEPAQLDPEITWDGAWAELTPRQREIREIAREVAVTELRPRAHLWDESETFPRETFEAVLETGLIGLTVPKEFGGQGEGLLEGCIVVEELARACLSTAMAVQPFLNGPWRAVNVLGTDDLRQRLLPGVADGTNHFAIAMSEPAAGTAGTDLRTTLTPEGDGFRLTGTKCWITGGREAHTIIVFCRIAGSEGPFGIGAVIVQGRPEGMSDFVVDPKMGIRGVGECLVHFDNVRIEPENVLIWPRIDSKEGTGVLVNQFNPERCGNAAMCTGLAQAALDASVGHLNAREQFGRPLATFQGLQWKIADMAMDVHVARVLLWRAARTGTDGFPDQTATLMAKLHSSEMVQRVTNEAIQIHGARGYSRRWPVERYFRDGRGLAIGGGTAEVMRNVLGAQVLGVSGSQRRR
ncbi:MULTISPECIES: acyl-CoA dehydrogenase family protein [unclassified Rhodococcus (in: high G+C Gram-positive bacteria)]|nr:MULTISPECIES: acyl-CoA dehydrogenase family protein [unclassified Rhodococcus (in: high G+C Gram-positive bacteria)]MCT7293635.1 acyl-CoA dehydrogenase family protein [Rhodococcus sp. PAE-6]QXU56419.1 acyl-CoA dehydrogenase family protein [Rhodococcus sp. LW-XY12]